MVDNQKHALPGFDLGEFRDLLQALQEAGYALTTVSEMNAVQSDRRLCLRHDVDAFPLAALEMARNEVTAGASATYYFWLSGPYNLWAAENRRIVRQIADMGHEVGLHYDLESYADNVDDALADLVEEVRMLEKLVGTSVRTISTHNPHKGGVDWFRECDRWLNPYDPRWQGDLMYVSDSCRAWRDENLLRCFSPDPPSRVLLLTHPELWLDGGIRDRAAYLERVLIPAAINSTREYFDITVREIWLTHPGALAHDARENQIEQSP